MKREKKNYNFYNDINRYRQYNIQRGQKVKNKTKKTILSSYALKNCNLNYIQKNIPSRFVYYAARQNDKYPLQYPLRRKTISIRLNEIIIKRDTHFFPITHEDNIMITTRRIDRKCREINNTTIFFLKKKMIFTNIRYESRNDNIITNKRVR